MKSGLLISGSAHGLLLSLVLLNGVFLLSDSLESSTKNMDIYIISEAEFDAEVSAPPSVYLDQKVNNETIFDSSKENLANIPTDNKISKIKEHSSDTLLESQIMDNSTSAILPNNALILNTNEMKLEKTLVQPDDDLNKIIENLNRNVNKVGNESMALLESPSLENPIARNEDRIDKVASDNKEVDTISDSAVSEQSDQTKEPKDESVTEDKVANKAATTEITPDGIQDAPIIVSGALTKSIIPPPREQEKSGQKTQSEDMESDQNHINTLLASINDDQIVNRPSKVTEISTMEKLKLRKNINQLLGRYWNKGILIGGSDFENYVIKIEILLDRNGSIIGDIRPLEPVVPTGRYAIAFREASNAIKAVGRIPIPSDKYENGLKLKLTFDPASGIGFD